MKTKPSRSQNWKSPRVWACLGLLCLAGMLLAGCQTGPATGTADAPASGAASYSTNNLAEGDVVNITFQYSTNFNAVQKIALDGTLNLQGVGVVKAAGKSTVQLQNELTGRYQSQVKDDPITIKIISTECAVYVAGAVTRPGRVPLEHPLTVLEAVMECGGYDPYRADLADVLVLRVEDGRQKSYRVNLKRVLEGRDDPVFYLQPSDVVEVSAKTFNF